MNILLKSATIIDEQNGVLHQKVRDILIKNGVIEKIAATLKPEGRTKVISLKNLHVSRGWVDSSVSFGEPGYEERETLAHGARVAALSGFTDVILNPNTRPIPDSSGDIVFLKKQAMDNGARIHPMGALTPESKGAALAELFDMKNSGAVAFYDFKKPIENSNLLKIALLYAQGFDGMVLSYPMDVAISGQGLVNESKTSTELGLKGIPSFSEEIQIARDLFILEYTGGKLHIPTISTAKSVDLIAEAKNKGLDVSCSVALSNLKFTDEVLSDYDTNYKVLPPLRSKKDIDALRKGVKKGIIDMVTTDHMPIDIEEKRIEFDHAAFGSLGLEWSFGILNSIFDLNETIRILTNGRSRFGLSESIIKEGEPAILSLFNPEGTKTYTEESILSTSRNSPYIGQTGRGEVYGSILKEQLYIK